ncbi:MAG: adenylyltransferase/cytidyltransferase family protein, partial [Thermoleophilia bacterium]|nr:adenylyltransferase/cytidyltransferase family protein [Thermoleophilia bacterium]
MSSTKIAIMGGTFNPIHIGHLVCAEEAVSQYGLDRVLFMPTGTPPHKEIEAGVSSEDRYRMTEIATADNPRFEVSR